MLRYCVIFCFDNSFVLIPKLNIENNKTIKDSIHRLKSGILYNRQSKVRLGNSRE